jgi:hypothetical protein
MAFAFTPAAPTDAACRALPADALACPAVACRESLRIKGWVRPKAVAYGDLTSQRRILI